MIYAKRYSQLSDEKLLELEGRLTDLTEEALSDLEAELGYRNIRSKNFDGERARRLLEPLKPPDTRKIKDLKEGFVSIVFAIILGIVCLWGGSYLTPHLSERSTLHDEKTQAAREDLYLSFAKLFQFSTINTIKLRLVPKMAGSVILYFPKELILDIPFPDRDFILTSITKKYCQNIGNSFLARVVLQDIRDGSEIISTSCLPFLLKK